MANMNQCFKNKNLDNVRICSEHFFSGKKADLYDRNNPDWCPTLRLGGSNPEPVVSTPLHSATPHVDRYKRVQERSKRKRLELIQNDEESTFESSDSGCEGVASQTDMDGIFINSMDCEIRRLREENLKLKKDNVVRLSKEDFEGNCEKVKHLTGLSTFALLMTLFSYLEPHLQPSGVLDQFRMMILTLMRLRLNLSVLFLSYEFGISQSSVSRIFSSVIDTMFARMKPFIHWPERETLQKTMPMQFRKHFGKRCCVIIDCFEVFIERPSNLKARAETWSSYKHHNTIKFLIGITPQGTVSFISRGWGGRVSDKYITEHSGFLNNIVPGDLILADRGFDIRDSVGTLCAQVNIPAFTNRRNQLSPTDVETTRNIANVRIHVERVIGTVRQKYSFLNGTIPIRFLMTKDSDFTVIDKIAHVCCSLVNLNDSVVDFN